VADRGARFRGFASKAIPALVCALAAAAAGAEPLAVGSALAAFEIDDQHGVTHRVDESVRILLFTREMKGGDVVKETLAETDASLLAERGAVYVADISGMPGLVARLFAIPRMRERPYPMLLDRDGELSRDFPSVEGQATVLFLEKLRVTKVEHFGSAQELRSALAPPPPVSDP
jgi:hypothetical protein